MGIWPVKIMFHSATVGLHIEDAIKQKSATVAENGEKTATVAEFGDSRTFLRRCG